MKKIILLFLLLGSTLKLSAQSPDYDDLKVLYASKEYEKLTRKAAGYTESDKTKNEALPYIWLSKALFQISLSDNTDEKYKKAGNDAINYLGKGLKVATKYDQWNLLEDHEDFIEELRLKQYYLMESDISMNEYAAYKKAYGSAMTYKKIMNSTIPIGFIVGTCKFMTKDKSGANREWKAAVDSLDALESIADWGEAEKKMLKLGVAHTAKAYMDSNQKELAQKLLGKMSQWFEEDSEWQDFYDNIVNSTN